MWSHWSHISLILNGDWRVASNYSRVFSPQPSAQQKSRFHSQQIEQKVTKHHWLDLGKNHAIYIVQSNILIHISSYFLLQIGYTSASPQTTASGFWIKACMRRSQGTPRRGWRTSSELETRSSWKNGERSTISLMVDGRWSMVDGWWLMVDGWWRWWWWGGGIFLLLLSSFLWPTMS